jgi:hypothetical protein
MAAGQVTCLQGSTGTQARVATSADLASNGAHSLRRLASNLPGSVAKGGIKLRGRASAWLHCLFLSENLEEHSLERPSAIIDK